MLSQENYRFGSFACIYKTMNVKKIIHGFLIPTGIPVHIQAFTPRKSYNLASFLASSKLWMSRSNLLAV